MRSGGRSAAGLQGGTARFAALRLAVRGIRWRRWASVATFLVATLAAAAAALGPLYALSAEDSLVSQRLADAPPITTGVLVHATNAGQVDQTPDDLLTQVSTVSADPRLDDAYGPAQLSVTRANVIVTLTEGVQPGRAPVAWREGQCVAVPILEGACPDGPQQVMVSERTAEDGGLAVGDTVVALLTPDLAANTLTIVGIYDQSRPDSVVYAIGTPATAAPPGGLGDGPADLDELLIDQETALRPVGEVGVAGFRALRTSEVDLAELPGIVADVEAMQAEARLAAGATYVVDSGLPVLVDSLGPERSLLRSSTLAVSAQVAVLVWFVLFLVVASATDERANEVAVAKLRGRRARSTLMFTVTEPLLLTTAGVPVGLVLAWLAALGLAARWFVPGTPVTYDATVLVAAGLALLGGLVACLLAGRKVLTVSVNDELRRTSTRRRAGGLVLDAVVVTLALASLTQIRGGQAKGLALLAPGLISLAVALLAVRILPFLVALRVRRTRGSRRVSTFLAVRNVARRPGSSRLVVLLTVAVGLAVFAVDGAAVAAEQRVAQAEVEVGAPQVVLLTGGSVGATLAAARAVDPDGAWAMAAVQAVSGEPDLLAVDSQRLAAVSVWTPQPSGRTLADVTAELHPPAAPPLVVTGRLDVTATLTSHQGNSDATQEQYQPVDDLQIVPTRLSVTTRRPDGRVVTVPMGVVRIGAQQLSVDLVGCDEGCALDGFVVESLGAYAESDTTLVVDDLADADGPLLLPAGEGTWRVGITGRELVDPGLASPASIETVAGGFTVRLTADGPNDVTVEYADHPVVLPAIVGPDTRLNPYTGAVSGYYGAGLNGTTVLVQPVEPPSVLPRLGTKGVLVDLPYALAADPTGTTAGTLQVWLGAAAPSDAVDQLAAAGLSVDRVETVANREQELGQDGAALAFPYFVVAAALAVVLAGGALLVTAAVGARRRSYELAALRVLGAQQRTLVAASRRELVLLTVFGTAVGTAGGLLAAALVLPYLPATAPVAVLADSPAGPAWLPVLMVVATVLLVTVGLAQVAAVRIARMSVPERLREAQA